MIETRTPEKIHMAIEEKLKNGATYIDALVDYAKQNNLEIETVANIVKKSSIIKEKIRSEAVLMKLVKREQNGAIELC
jgi:uncharacterized membrane-anchored protein YitT (DUF2179 family)|tara:strand:+ start:2906 stop:3139 length:234 start_codon:yes stop_codon:yes gene_type:complete